MMRTMNSERVVPIAGTFESLENFQRLFREHPVPIMIIEKRTGFFLFANPAAVQRYGYGVEEFLNLTADQVIERKEATLFFDGNLPLICQHRTKNGSVFQAASRYQEIFVEGVVAYLVFNDDHGAKDVAKLQNREQAELLNLASDAIMVHDLEHRLLFWNYGATRLYGWTVDDAVGLRTLDLFVREKIQMIEAGEQLIKDGSWSGQFSHATKDGREVIVSSRWTLVRDGDGYPTSVLTIDTDITETKKLESQFLRAQRLESLGTLAGGIAHDLNNILSPILMAASILRRPSMDPEDEQMLNIIESSAERGAGIVKQVLTFARGEGGDRLLLQPKYLVNELAKIIGQTFPKNIDIQTTLNPDLWTVIGDATQLHQVLLNLCVNARDALSSGGVLTVTAENLDIDEHFAQMHPGSSLGFYVALRVTDNGVGIPSETLDKIFDPFFTTKEVGKGTGLGLATVSGIVKSHGGFLSVKSVVGLGTTFSVFLPASKDAEAEQPVESVAVVDGHGELILVVDDEAPIREALVSTLTAHGYRAYTAEDGKDALAIYFQRRGEIDLVLTDLSMGEMDGIALVRALHKINPEVKVVVSSGHFHKESRAILGGLGVKVLLEKPYTAEKLLRTVGAQFTTLED